MTHIHLGNAICPLCPVRLPCWICPQNRFQAKHMAHRCSLQGTMTRAQFTSWLCREASSACKSKPPKVPADRKPGGPFKVADPQERQMAKMMASMKVR